MMTKTKIQFSCTMENNGVSEAVQKKTGPFNVEIIPPLSGVKDTEDVADVEHCDNTATVTTEFKSRKGPQLIAAFAALLGAFSYGCIMGYAAVSMPKLRHDHSFPHPTEDEISMMSSIISLGALAGNIPAGFATDKIGRRMTMIILTIPFVGGWLCIYFAQNVFILILGRFITGFCGGSFTLAAPIFIAETSDPDIRGALITGFDVMVVAGIIFMSIIGKFLAWRTQALVVAFIPCLTLVILYFVPESPRFLLSQGKQEQAFKSFCWFQGASKPQRKDLKDKFNALLKNIEMTQEQTSRLGIRSQFKEFTRKPVLKAFFIIFMLFLFRECSGIAAVDLYSIDIFESAGFNSEIGTLDAYTLVICMHTISDIFLVVSAFFMDRMNRKRLVLPCETLMVVAFAALGAFFYIKERNPELADNTLHFIPPLALFLFTIGHVAGIGPIPLIIMPEILPQNVRAVASMLLLIVKWVAAFLISRYFKNYIDLVGEPAGYWTFSAICFSALLFVLLYLPSNEGKTLEQIQIERNKKKSHDAEIVTEKFHFNYQNY